jgi:serine/threonine protein kinase
MQLLKALSHPNIVGCRESFVHGGSLCIIMDYCSQGDLNAIMHRRRGKPLSQDTVLDWFVQICLALKHCHDRRILHRDVKAQNIFVAANGLIKLGDFGSFLATPTPHQQLAHRQGASAVADHDPRASSPTQVFPQCSIPPTPWLPLALGRHTT